MCHKIQSANNPHFRVLSILSLEKMWTFINLRNILKVTIYLVLLIAFLKFYFFLQLFDYLKDNTSFTTTFVKEDKFMLPSFVLCIPGIKQEVQEEYGYDSSYSVISDPSGNYEKLNVTPMKIIRAMHYKVDEDFSLDISFYLGNIFYLHLGENRNENGDGKILLSEISATSGFCYLLEPEFNLPINASAWLKIVIRPNKSMTGMDKFQNIEIFVASNDTWQGFYFYSWPYFDVSRLSIPFDTNRQTIIEMTPTLIEFRDGVLDAATCYEEKVKQINCPYLCYPATFDKLAKIPDCKTRKEVECMLSKGFWNPELEKDFVECQRLAKTMTYKAKDIMKRPAYPKTNSSEIVVWMIYSTNLLRVRKEVLSLGTTTFIGSVGGSLGLFLGFSCYTFLESMIDYLTKK